MTPIVIMTYGRANLQQQLTWQALSPELRGRVIFAVRKEEAKFFENLSQVFVLPKSVSNLATTRQAIWDHFNKTEETWFQIDDDLKGIRLLESFDPTRKPMFVHRVLREDIGLAFDACEEMMSNNPDVGTVSPRQIFKPPRAPKPGNRWSTSLVVGFNLFNSEINNRLNFKFVSNYCGDAEMCLTMLAHGYDTVWLDNFEVSMMPPTKSATIRKQSIEEWDDLVARWSNYIDYVGNVNSWSSSRLRELHDNPAKLYRMKRARILKDYKANALKPIVFSNQVQGVNG